MPKIMIIEDDTTMLSLLQTLLSMEGYEIIRFREDGLEGVLSSAQEAHPDLALIDVHLRTFSGFDLLERFRAHQALQNTRIIMSSGMDVRTECLQKGADEFILKPYMPDDLIHLVHQVVKA